MSEPKVYRAICAITEELSHVGISKGRENKQQNYAFRGIDDVYAALSPLLAKHRLCILPRVVDKTVTEKVSKSGSCLFYTSCKMEFDFVSAEDGSKHTVATLGEAMDSGDKGSGKCMSTAYKYACFQAFCIPTEGDNDVENHNFDVAPSEYEPPQHIQNEMPPSLPPQITLQDTERWEKALRLCDAPELKTQKKKMAELQRVWGDMPHQYRLLHQTLKDDMKNKIMAEA